MSALHWVHASPLVNHHLSDDSLSETSVEELWIYFPVILTRIFGKQDAVNGSGVGSSVVGLGRVSGEGGATENSWMFATWVSYWVWKGEEGGRGSYSIVDFLRRMTIDHPSPARHNWGRSLVDSRNFSLWGGVLRDKNIFCCRWITCEAKNPLIAYGFTKPFVIFTGRRFSPLLTSSTITIRQTSRAEDWASMGEWICVTHRTITPCWSAVQLFLRGLPYWLILT